MTATLIRLLKTFETIVTIILIVCGLPIWALGYIVCFFIRMFLAGWNKANAS